MLTSRELKDRKSRITAGAATILLHALIVIALVLLAFHTPLPLPAEEGVEVSLGNVTQAESGIQSEVPALMPGPASQPVQILKRKNPMTENTEEYPVGVNTKRRTKYTNSIPATKPRTIVETPNEIFINPSELMAGKNTRSAPAGNQGLSRNSSRRGESYTTESGSDKDGNLDKQVIVLYDLYGRGAGSLPKPYSNPYIKGKIVVSIIVNKQGQVIYARSGARGTSVSKINLRRQAEKAALKAIFTPDPAAPDKQRGTITYIFIRNK